MECCGTPVTPAAMSFSFAVLFGFGLTMSVGHCLGMCGPLVTAVGSYQRRDGASAPVLVVRLLTYHGARVVSYMLLGAAAGLLAAAITSQGDGGRLQGGLSLAVGVLMLLTAVGILSLEKWEKGGPMQRFIAPRFGRLLESGGVKGRVLLGLANGFLPCGPVYKAAMTATATGSAFKGSLAMLWFGLGTVPVLVLVGVGAAQLGLRTRTFFNRVGAALVVVMGVQLILRGLAFWQVVPHLRWGEVVFY